MRIIDITVNAHDNPFRDLRELNPGRVQTQVLALFAFLLVWEVVGRSTSPLFLAPPSDVVLFLIDLLTTPAFISDLLEGLWSVVVGVLLASALGLVLGLSMGFSDTVRYAFDPYVTILYGLPIIAVIPLIVLLFGAGFGPSVFIIFLFTFLPVTINAQEGVEETPEDLIEVAESFGASRFQTLREVHLPALIPYIMSGFRLGVGRGLRGWILAELFFLFGVGGRLINYGHAFETAGVFAILLLLVVIGLVSLFGMQALIDHIAPWHSEQQSEGVL